VASVFSGIADRMIVTGVGNCTQVPFDRGQWSRSDYAVGGKFWA
jgi:hypothetical protein